MNTTPKKTSALAVLLAWLVVLLPLGWGFYRSMLNSKPLFAGKPLQAPVAPPPKNPASP